MVKHLQHLLLSLLIAFAPTQIFAQSKTDILILGDSQISFGAGEVYLDFFKALKRNCGPALSRAERKKLGKRRTLAVGVRSTSLHSWVARDGAPKDTICEVDKKFGVNAGVYGINGSDERKFIQIGQERGFKYCRKNRSAFETVFSDPENRPKLLVLNFLGNAEKRWAESQSLADRDVRQTLKQIPKDIPCIVLTSAPVFHKATNDRRMLAQARLARALEKTDGQCQLVKGFTPQTRKAIEGKPQFFKRNKSGKITDPHHPSKAAIKRFLNATAPQFCEAMALVLK